MRVGGWHGWAQSFADGIKLVCKEDLVPGHADALLFRAAPYITLIPVVVAFAALPFASYWGFRNLDVGLVFILAMLGVEVVGVIMAGWSSNSKWTTYGAMREACQMVSYEIPLAVTLLLPVLTVGSLNLSTIGEVQSGGWHTWLVFQSPFMFAAALSYYVASLASCKRAPFDLPESESELVAGFHTEYSGFRWMMFFFGEYVAMFIVSGLAVILFLGGWKSPLPAHWLEADWLTRNVFVYHFVRGLLFDGPILFVLKAAFLYYVQLWIRWTLPRIRIDQVLYACVQVLLPITMVVLLGNTLWILFIEHLEIGWIQTLDAWLHRLLVAIGAILIAAMLAIAGYGRLNRRRLVGRLVIDHLPGS
jgi:NADH-quinone oxidoreductase subunit H